MLAPAFVKYVLVINRNLFVVFIDFEMCNQSS